VSTTILKNINIAQTHILFHTSKSDTVAARI